MSKIRSEILERQDAAFRYLQNKRTLWDNLEELFHGQLNDNVSSKAKSQVFDPKLSTLVMERSFRVMSQLQTGKVIGVSKNDIGDAKLKNLLLEKYVLPNANAQFDFLTKMRMVDMYSNIYGNFFTLTDWDVRQDGYVGPDVWLLNIRDVFPQVGAVSLQDSDHVIVRTWRPLSYFKSMAKDKDFKNMSKVIAKLEKASGNKTHRDSDDKSKRDEDQYQEAQAAKKAGYFEVLTQYERDRWVDFSVDADMEFRDIANPHDNGELPVDCKYSIPLLDDFMGMSDMERGAPMQKTINSVWNLYLDAVKMSIFPPKLINKDNIASFASLKEAPAAKWLVRNQISNAVQSMPVSPQGINTFNNTYQVGTAALLNLFGTTDTTVTSQTDPGLGKTPEALQQLKQRENTRDNADRYYMEKYLTSVMKKMVNLLCKKQSSDITIRMFEEEVETISRDYPEIKDLYDEETGELSVKKGSDKMLYDYEIVSGSTYAVDQDAQQENMKLLMQMYVSAQTPQGNWLIDQLAKEGYDFKFGELFKRNISNSGIQDWDKILVEKTEQEKSEMVLEDDMQKFQQAISGMQGMNGVPPMPGVQG